MTNEKAVDLLRRMQEPEVYEPPITEEAFEALELAIKALGTDTNVGTTDAISRQAAMDALNHELRCGAVINQCGLEVAYEVIEGLPPAEQDIIRCKDCKWWTKQKDSLQGRCELTGSYPTSEWYCGNARKRKATT